jgi:hypothetical protein
MAMVRFRVVAKPASETSSLRKSRATAVGQTSQNISHMRKNVMPATQLPPQGLAFCDGTMTEK